MRTSRIATLLFVSLSACVVGDPTIGGPGPGSGSNPSGGGGSGSDPSGGGSGSDPGGGGPVTTATDFLAAMDQGFCDEAFKCMASFPTTAGETFAQAFGASAADCESMSAASEMPAAVESEITAGKIHFDANAAAACVAGVTFPACATFWSAGPTYPNECGGALVGTIADGGACVVDFDCSSAASICNAGTCGPDPGAGSARGDVVTRLRF